MPLLLSALPSAWAIEGAERGGLDQLGKDSKSAWFLAEKDSRGGPLNTRIIQICLENESFGISDGDLAKHIDKAFNRWKAYLDDKTWGESIGGTLVFRRQIKKGCDGTQDLAFYFGKTNEAVEREKKKFLDPIAFPARTHYDAEKGWGRGLIWIAPPGAELFIQTAVYHKIQWAEELPLLEGALLHEVGHVLGNSDFPGTIMDPDALVHIWRYLKFGAPKNTIIWHKELGPSLMTDLIVTSPAHDTIESKKSGLDYKDIAESFKLFSGIEPSWPITVSWVPGSQGPSFYKPEKTLILSDGKNQVRLTLHYGSEESFPNERIFAFYSWKDYPGDTEVTPGFWVKNASRGSFPYEQSSTLCILQTPDGREFPCFLDYNMGNSYSGYPVELKYFLGGRKVLLYRLIPKKY